MGSEHKFSFKSGIEGFDTTIRGIIQGDNVVFKVDSIKEFLPFVVPFVQQCQKDQKELIYFRFADHQYLLPSDIPVHVYNLHPELGFEPFILEIFVIIEKFGYGACYVFDCLSDLAVPWYSDENIGNFFMLTCPYLYDFETVTYFAIIRNHHAIHVVQNIQKTAQVIIEVYKNNGQRYIQPLKVFQRHSPTIYNLHIWQGNQFFPYTQSGVISEILNKIQQPWIDYTVKHPDIWETTIRQTQEAIRKGVLTSQEEITRSARLLRMMIAREERLLQLAEKHLKLEDLLSIGKRMIGTGLIGGKSVGMLIAQAILKKQDSYWINRLETHDSFFIGSDVYYTFLVRNKCWWDRRKVTSPKTFLQGLEALREKIKNGNFPDYILAQFNEMIQYYGQSPIIVRSSSLLEDAYGNSFSGKYESVFCANQGDIETRLAQFVEAVKIVYASTINKDALIYRKSRNLLNKDEQMAVLVQRVSGQMYGNNYFPQIAGVAFSFNPFVWDTKIDPKAGMLRLVFGLGTRAVERTEDDYTRLVALNVPTLRPESTLDEIGKYSQHKVDVLDLSQNRLKSEYFQEVAENQPHLPLDLFSICNEEYIERMRERGRDSVFARILTFESLLTQTTFSKDMQNLLQILSQAYDYPVDIEFAANFQNPTEYKINLLQCRPFQVKGLSYNIEPPGNIPQEEIIFQTTGPIIGPSKDTFVDRIIYVVPAVYGKMSINDRYTVARAIGKITHFDEDRHLKIMLLGPGRWASSNPTLGVSVSFSEINTVTIIAEIAEMHEGLIPDVSLGTHFFNDLVEVDMLYCALYPDKPNCSINKNFFNITPNKLSEMAPELADLNHVIRVIDPIDAVIPYNIRVNINTITQKGVCYRMKKIDIGK